ncbi:MAG: hypothetical protein PHV37_02715 [Candidatus Gastranaerophilales bacterium]|nr:hypothetical protein [Candidatus Gastranaerophilales bacterium]
MKKIILSFAVFLLGNIVFAQDTISFIYINGSNNNDVKMKNWFFNGVDKLHPQLKYRFENDALIKQQLLNNGKISIQSTAVPFFWGEASSKEISAVDAGLDFIKLASPKIAQAVRAFFAHCMHDAIWVQKPHNMSPIVDELNQTVQAEYKAGKNVVLFGYSAGTFINYEYLFSKLTYINLYDFFSKTQISQGEKIYVKQNPKRNTCISAIVDSKLAVFSSTGHLIPNINSDLFKKNYNNIDYYTNTSCAPEHAVKGIVNFASPLVLFYSDLSDPHYELSYYNKLLYEYLIENNMFWLTVNYSEDPLGFPTTKNLSPAQIALYTNMNIDPVSGFIYDKSDVKSRHTFMGAHTSYWSTAKHFSKIVVDAYNEGYHLYHQ